MEIQTLYAIQSLIGFFYVIFKGSEKGINGLGAWVGFLFLGFFLPVIAVIWLNSKNRS
jgi:hypothetical protein